MEASPALPLFTLRTIGGVFLIQFLGLIVYRWKFHQLSKYPGPFLAAITDLYPLYFQLTGSSHIQSHLLHQRYGPVVRISPNRLMFITPKARTDIYQSRKLHKPASYPAMSAVPGQDNIFTTANKDAHRLRRKALAPAFSEDFIHKFEDVIISNSETFVAHILPQDTPTTGADEANDWSPVRDVGKQCSYFTLDLVALFGFGCSYNLQTSSQNRGVLKSFQKIGYYNGLINEAIWIKRFNLGYHIASYVYAGGWSIMENATFIRNMIKTRLSVGSDAKPDILDVISRSKDPETVEWLKDLNNLWAESRFLLAAGSDTTASALAALFFYLSRYPACCDKLAVELRKNFATSEDIKQGQALNRCTYLRAVVDESLRLAPPVAKVVWREAGTDGVTIDGTFVPAGVEVGSSSYAIFHDEQIYPDASTFIPERWFDSSEKFKERLPQAKAAFKPFGLGSRGCIASNLSYAEMTLLVSKVIWNCEISQPTGPEARIGEGGPNLPKGRQNPKELQFKHTVTATWSGPHLQFRRRVV